MDKIELRVLQCDGAPLQGRLGAVFGMAGGTIGRGGQNKLILPGTDTAVARVHAMVRLDHEGAFIANLSESRPIWVAEQIVQSGEEVRLALHASVRIGAYTLSAVEPGSPYVEAVAAAPSSLAPPPAPSSAAPAPAGPAKVPGSAAIAASAVEHIEPAKVQPPATGAIAAQDTLSSLLPSAPVTVDGTDIMALLAGKAESAPAVGSDGLADAEAAEPALNPWAGTAATEAATVPPLMEALPQPAPASAATSHASALVPPPAPASPAEKRPPSPSLAANPMPSSGKVAPAPQTPWPMIPDDFDPFAPTTSQQNREMDGWGGAGLSLQDLIAPPPSVTQDEMVRNLPLQGKFEHSFDNPSHTGLPQRYEAPQTLDPLAMFGAAAPSVDLLSATQPMARGSELAQAFNLPRTETSSSANAPASMALPPAAAAPAAPEFPIPAEPPALPPMGSGADALLADLLPAADLSSLDFGDLMQPSAPVSAPQAPALPQAATLPAAPVAPPAIPVAAAPAPAAAGNAGSEQPDSLAVAFMQGAGLDPAKGQFKVTPEFMRTFGEVLRVSVQGTIDLLAARSEIKREFRAGVTIIASGANNPLKFLPSAEGVIMQMTNKAFPGFMGPVPAMEEAYMDLRVHQLALMAGIRAAYAEALTRFDPNELERRTDGTGGLLDKFLATGRKAALWDDYKHNFDVLRRHAEDDLSAFSGQSFLDAYEQAAHAAKDRQGPSS